MPEGPSPGPPPEAFSATAKGAALPGLVEDQAPRQHPCRRPLPPVVGAGAADNSTGDPPCGPLQKCPGHAHITASADQLLISMEESLVVRPVHRDRAGGPHAESSRGRQRAPLPASSHGVSRATARARTLQFCPGSAMRSSRRRHPPRRGRKSGSMPARGRETALPPCACGAAVLPCHRYAGGGGMRSRAFVVVEREGRFPNAQGISACSRSPVISRRQPFGLCVKLPGRPGACAA